MQKLEHKLADINSMFKDDSEENEQLIEMNGNQQHEHACEDNNIKSSQDLLVEKCESLEACV